MDWGWLWHDLSSQAVYALLIIGGGALIGYLKKKMTTWDMAPILYGLCTSAFLAVIWVAVQQHFAFPVTLDTGNAQILCKKWLEADTAVSTRPISQSEAPDNIFSLGVTFPGGDHLAVSRPREWDREIHIVQNIQIDPRSKSALEGLSTDDSDLLNTEITKELLRSRLQFELHQPWERIRLDRRIFLTGNTTEEAFLGAVADVESTSMIVRNMIDVAIRRAEHAKANPPKT